MIKENYDRLYSKDIYVELMNIGLHL